MGAIGLLSKQFLECYLTSEPVPYDRKRRGLSMPDERVYLDKMLSTCSQEGTNAQGAPSRNSTISGLHGKGSDPLAPNGHERGFLPSELVLTCFIDSDDWYTSVPLVTMSQIPLDYN